MTIPERDASRSSNISAQARLGIAGYRVNALSPVAVLVTDGRSFSFTSTPLPSLITPSFPIDTVRIILKGVELKSSPWRTATHSP